MSFNILLWCDVMISYLKENDIEFRNGVAVLPRTAIYEGPIKMISTYKYRRDIPHEIKKDSLLCYFMLEPDLIPRMKKIIKELSEIKEYGGICGFDLSPCLGMLMPRQRLSILANSLFNCFCGVNGIKILPNSRVGDFSTMSMTVGFPDDVGFVSGKLGCNNYGFKNYGLYQLGLTINSKNPPFVAIYGGLSLKDARKIFRYSKRSDLKIFVFRDRRDRVRNGAKDYYYAYENGVIKKFPSPNNEEGGERNER